jgi:hypothetical protein
MTSGWANCTAVNAPRSDWLDKHPNKWFSKLILQWMCQRLPREWASEWVSEQISVRVPVRGDAIKWQKIGLPLTVSVKVKSPLFLSKHHIMRAYPLLNYYAKKICPLLNYHAKKIWTLLNYRAKKIRPLINYRAKKICPLLNYHAKKICPLLNYCANVTFQYSFFGSETYRQSAPCELEHCHVG